MMPTLSILRFPLIFLLAISVSLGLFGFMFGLIRSDGQIANSNRDSQRVDFVRIKRDTDTRKKQRQKKEPPKIKKPSIPKSSLAQTNTAAAQVLAIDLPNISSNMSVGVGSQSFLAGARVGMGFGDSDVLPLVKARPVYPQAALNRGISGSVTATLKVNERGTVDRVDILEATPAGVFNREAIRALYRYKFKPKLIDGKPVSQVVTQTVKFNVPSNN